MSDRRLLYCTAFLRALATGMIGVLLGVYLARRGLDAAETGIIVTAGLSGAALAALLVTLAGNRVPRRRVLFALALLGTFGTAMMALTDTVLAAAAAAFVGMINGMGRDRGASLVIEQAVLPVTVPDTGRTRAFAWYNVLQDAGHALGALAAGLPALLAGAGRFDEMAALQWALFANAGLFVLMAFAYRGLSPALEPAIEAAARTVSDESRRRIWKISALFAIDSIAGGFLTATLLTVFFHERFGAGLPAIGLLFFGARIANAASHLAAAWLARHIGLVNTMVFTHIPSSLLLMTVAFAPSFPVAAVLFLVREGLVEMDVPTRQSYVMAMVRPGERIFASGVTHLVRMAGWAIAPAFAGLLMQSSSMAAPLIVGAAMKIAYDVLLYLSFRKLRPPEESG